MAKRKRTRTRSTAQATQNQKPKAQPEPLMDDSSEEQVTEATPENAPSPETTPENKPLTNGAPTSLTSENYAEGVTDPNDTDDRAPSSPMGGGPVSLEDLTGMIQEEFGEELPSIDGDAIRMLNCKILQSVQSTLFLTWAKVSKDPSKILGDIENKSLGEANEMFISKHWPDLLNDYMVEINFLSQWIMVITTRIGNGNNANRSDPVRITESAEENADKAVSEPSPILEPA